MKMKEQEQKLPAEADDEKRRGYIVHYGGKVEG